MTKKEFLSYKWELIVLLWFAFFFNQADRQAYNVVLPLLSADLKLSPVQAGLVASIFLWCYALLVPVAGYLGDISRRKWIVFWSLLVWSGGTILSGATTGLASLIVFRSIATGGGEAFYFPSANSLIGQYHQKTRAMAMSIHQTALYVGLIASGFIAGWIGERFGWRSSFYVFGAIGVVLALIIMVRLKDEGLSEEATTQAKSARLPLPVVLKAIAGKPTVWALWLAFSCFYFAQIGYITWMPSFLHEKFKLSLSNAGFSSMFYHHVAAMIGVLLGGKVSDLLAMRRRTVRLEVEYIGLFLGAPFICLMGLTDNLLLCYVGLAGFGLFRGIYDSNLYAALFDVIEPRFRASAVGIMLAVVFFVSAFAPVALGWAKSTIGLTAGLASLSLAYIVGGSIILLALKTTFRRDYYNETQPSAQPATK
ncbi:MAG: MFS transporter [Verrucomicrobia bacterium]|nr:MFS transporter [Verrucomicrobiota bacterium]